MRFIRTEDASRATVRLLPKSGTVGCTDQVRLKTRPRLLANALARGGGTAFAI